MPTRPRRDIYMANLSWRAAILAKEKTSRDAVSMTLKTESARQVQDAKSAPARAIAAAVEAADQELKTPPPP